MHRIYHVARIHHGHGADEVNGTETASRPGIGVRAEFSLPLIQQPEI